MRLTGSCTAQPSAWLPSQDRKGAGAVSGPARQEAASEIDRQLCCAAQHVAALPQGCSCLFLVLSQETSGRCAPDRPALLRHPDVEAGSKGYLLEGWIRPNPPESTC